ncbi:MAG: NAD(P)-binding domain-containing protein [Spirochaetota bacterium]
MKIGILGSGMVGQTLARALAKVGNEVMIGTRSPAKLADFLAQAPRVRVGSFADSAAFGELVFNATKGDASLEVVKAAGAVNLKGKILVDVANPLDFSQGMPPTLFVGNSDSLAETIQRALPDSKVVKAFNTMAAAMMVEPRSLADGNHSLFICGNDSGSKTRVAALASEWFGWRDVIDVGDLTGARATEALLPLWIRLFGKFGAGNIQFKVVR